MSQLPQWVPDISHHQAGISIQALRNEGAAALIARVGQGAGRRDNGKTYDTTRDREWVRHRDEAQRVGLDLVAYWYTGNLLTAADNAELAAEWVGDRAIPWMLDHEDASGSIDFYHEVLTEFDALGLDVIFGYLPRWYWSGHGSASLTPGPPLVNSAYPDGAGTPAQIWGDGHLHQKNFTSYGGQTVAMVQFTNQAQMAGYKIDCSAWPGSREELHAYITGAEAAPLTMAGNEEKMLITCTDYEGGKAGILSGGVLLDLTSDAPSRDWAQDQINRGLLVELRVGKANWDLLYGTSLLTRPATSQAGGQPTEGQQR
jgi:lysozyme